jgi:hypothetical protein
MSSDATTPDDTPNQTDVIPDSYGIHVMDEQIHVWQYRIGVTEPAGQWRFVETLDRTDDPKLSLEYASPMAPATDGYWIYSRSYDCELDCE